MGTPKFLRYSIRRALSNVTLGPSGGQVYPPVYQYNFDGIDDYGTIPPITLEGDFEVSLYATVGQVGSYMSLGDTSNLNTRGFYHNSGTGRYTCYFSTTGTGEIILNSEAGSLRDPDVEVFHSLKKTGDLCEYYIDNTLVASSTFTDLGDVVIDIVGCRGSFASFWNGNIREVYFNDLSSPSNSRLYKINEGPGSTVMIDSLSSGGSTNGTYNNFNDERWESV